MTKKSVTIPETELDAMIRRTKVLKQAMTDQLIELETKVTGKIPDRPGKWRHDPLGWYRRFFS